MIIHLKDDIIYERLLLPVHLYNTRGSRCSFYMTTSLLHHHLKLVFDALLLRRFHISHDVCGGGGDEHLMGSLEQGTFLPPRCHMRIRGGHSF